MPMSIDFSLETLTATINETSYKPRRLSGLFDEQGITTTTAVVEKRKNTLQLVPIAPRNGAAAPAGGDNRRVHSFPVPHIPLIDALAADEIQNVRAFGSSDESEAVDLVVNRKLANMRDSLEYTLESHRLAAIKGQYFDASGGTQSLHTAFGTSQQTHTFGMADADAPADVQVLKVLEKIEKGLDGVGYDSVVILCGATFWQKLIANKSLREVYLQAMQAQTLNKSPTVAFAYAGVVFERYRGTSEVKIEDDKAYALPEGVSDMYITRFSPANYNETVNTIGLPVYAKAWETEGGKGYKLEVQSNPINLCTRPDAVIKLSI